MSDPTSESHPFAMWSDKLAHAGTDDTRRQLLQEARLFRARSLGDVPASRRATFTISRLHQLLGERDAAVHEARQLFSLCQSAPVAAREELDAARSWLQGLGQHAPKVVSPPRERSWTDPRDARPRRDGPDRGAPGDRAPRERAAHPAGPGPARTPTREPRRELPRAEAAEGARPDRAAERARVDAARRLAAEGRAADALAELGDARGPGVEVLRIALSLGVALASDGPLDAVKALHLDLARRAGLVAPDGDPLSALLGAPAPIRREARIAAIEAFAADHPGRIDDLAAAALRHHVATSGPGAPAPWLVGTVARALATGNAPATESALAELRAQGAVAVTAYAEWPFERLGRLVARALATGIEVVGLRRGVLARNEPDDRKVWTLRLGTADGERLVAVAPHAVAPYDDGKAEELAERIHALCGAAVLLATGPGNEALRAAAAAHGVVALDRDADDGVILDAALQLPAAPKTERRPPRAAPADEPRPPQAERAPREPRAAEPPKGERLGDLVVQEPLDLAKIEAAVAGMKRPDRALRIVGRLPLSPAALAAVLGAVAKHTDGRPIPEGTTLALRAALVGGSDAPLADPRYGGPGVEVALAVARMLHAEGWDVFRVLRGTTRREISAHPVLETLEAHLDGLWRLLVRQGDRKGEVWCVSALAPEGRAAVPTLLLEDWQRAVIVADDALRAWWSTLGAAHPLDRDAVLAAVGAFVVRAAPPDEPAEG